MNRIKQLVLQFSKFSVVGTLSFCLDYGLMVVLTEVVGWDYFFSCATSYTASVIFNYILSMKFVFQSREDFSKIKEMFIFFLLSFIGLGLNQMIMWILVESLHIFYAIAKVLASLLVTTYNFVSRKMFLESSEEETES